MDPRRQRRRKYYIAQDLAEMVRENRKNENTPTLPLGLSRAIRALRFPPEPSSSDGGSFRSAVGPSTSASCGDEATMQRILHPPPSLNYFAGGEERSHVQSPMPSTSYAREVNPEDYMPVRPIKFRSLVDPSNEESGIYAVNQGLFSLAISQPAVEPINAGPSLFHGAMAPRDVVETERNESAGNSSTPAAAEQGQVGGQGQCDGPFAGQGRNWLRNITARLGRLWPLGALEWANAIFRDVRSFINEMCIWTQRPGPCDCEARLAAIDEKLMQLEDAMVRIQSCQQQGNMLVIPCDTSEDLKGEVPTPPPPPPPFPPVLPTPPPMPLMGTRILTQKAERTKTPQTGRPLITAEDLLSVKLKKVSQSQGLAKGRNPGDPMVTLDQLRAVKLRPRRKPGQGMSPPRQPIAHDRVGRNRSPVIRQGVDWRSRSRSRIPLSTILNFDKAHNG